jgi:septal ring factor EnvC (AmiA/AmiB activator)
MIQTENIGVNMKKFLIIIMCFSAMLCFAQSDLAKKEKDLVKQEKKIAKEMFEMRVKLLGKEPHLKKLHDKIMELHKELALMLDRQKEMRELASKLKKVKKSLNAIRDKKSMDDEDNNDDDDDDDDGVLN